MSVKSKQKNNSKQFHMEKKRNLWVIPTDNSSRLFYNVGGALLFTKWDNYNGVNIYITSDEYIGLSYYLDGNLVRKGVIDDKEYWEVRKDYKKIILTTDQDLIKDGVQAIDDEFLEWFVKNPSFERIEVNGISDVALGGFADVYYKIIIPRTTQQIINEDYAGGLEMGQIPAKEEPKQEFPKPNIIDNWLEKNGDPEIAKQVEQEAKELCEQETLEEVAERVTEEWFNNNSYAKELFIEGVKWQQEQILDFLYEEITERRDYSASKMCEKVIEFIEKFKKK